MQYRLVLKLNYCAANLSALNLVQTHIGGRVCVCNKHTHNGTFHADFVLWVVDSRKSFLQVIRIFEIYPPQTSRLSAQLRFARLCLEHSDVDLYLKTRGTKYLEHTPTKIYASEASFFNE